MAMSIWTFASKHSISSIIRSSGAEHDVQYTGIRFRIEPGEDAAPTSVRTQAQVLTSLPKKMGSSAPCDLDECAVDVMFAQHRLKFGGQVLIGDDLVNIAERRHVDHGIAAELRAIGNDDDFRRSTNHCTQ